MQTLIMKLLALIPIAFCIGGVTQAASVDVVLGMESGEASLSERQQLARTILQDQRLDDVLRMGYELLESVSY